MKRPLSVLALALLAGCSTGSSTTNNNPNPNNLTRAALIGTWNYASVRRASSGSPIACPGGVLTPGSTTTYDIYCGASDSMTLNTNNTFTRRMTERNGSTVVNHTGTWGLSGTTFSMQITSSNAGLLDSWTASLSADGKTLTLNDSLYITTFSKQ